MESVNYNCESQKPNSIPDPQKDDSQTTKGPLTRELPPFSHTTFAISLVVFSLFYCIIWNIEDKTNLAKASTLFTYVNSLINTLCWIFYYFTANTNYLIHGIASFLMSLIAELFYGTRHYPNYMYTLTTYIHHIAFIIITSIAFWTDTLQYTSLALLIEFPTFVLHHKRRYLDNSPWLNHLFGISFLAFRIFYWVWLFFLHPILKKIQWIQNTSVFILFVFVYWFVIWFQKQYKNMNPVYT